MKKILYVVILALVALLIYLTFTSTGNDSTYAESVESVRQNRENYLKSGSESPFVLKKIDWYPLSYFPIDEDYKVNAQVQRIESREFVSISNSNGSSQRYLKYAWLTFKIEGIDQKLLVLKPLFAPNLFLAFADLTSGDDSYGAGRYIDLESIKGDRVTIDFNLSYNPYCAYSDGFTCPFPPKENILNVPIRAGEKYDHK